MGGSPKVKDHLLGSKRTKPLQSGRTSHHLAHIDGMDVDSKGPVVAQASAHLSVPILVVPCLLVLPRAPPPRHPDRALCGCRMTLSCPLSSFPVSRHLVTTAQPATRVLYVTGWGSHNNLDDFRLRIQDSHRTRHGIHIYDPVFCACTFRGRYLAFATAIVPTRRPNSKCHHLQALEVLQQPQPASPFISVFVHFSMFTDFHRFSFAPLFHSMPPMRIPTHSFIQPTKIPLISTQSATFFFQLPCLPGNEEIPETSQWILLRSKWHMTANPWHSR